MHPVILIYGTHFSRVNIFTKALSMLDKRFVSTSLLEYRMDKGNTVEIPVIHMESVEELLHLAKSNNDAVKVCIWETLESLNKRLNKQFNNDLETVEKHLLEAKESLLYLKTLDLLITFDHILNDTKSPVDTALDLIYNFDSNPQFQEELQKLESYLNENL